MGVHGHGWLPERCVQHHISRFTADAGQGFQVFPPGRDFTAVFLDQNAAGLDHILGLAVKQPDGLDVFLQAVNAQGKNGLGRVRYREQLVGGLVHAYVCGLSGENDRNQ